MIKVPPLMIRQYFSRSPGSRIIRNTAAVVSILTTMLHVVVFLNCSMPNRNQLMSSMESTMRMACTAVTAWSSRTKKNVHPR